MFRIAIGQIFKDWKTVLGTFVSLLATAILLTSFVILSGTAIHEVILGSKSHLKNNTLPMIVFNVIGGITIMIASISTAMITIQSIRRRNKLFNQLRILGATYFQMKKLILSEVIFISIFAFVIGAPIAIPVANLINEYMIKNNVLESAFKPEIKYFYFLIAFGIAFLIVLIVTLISMKAFKKVSISEVKKSRVKLIFKWLVGAACLGGSLSLLMIPGLRQGGLGVGMVTNSILLFTISLVIFGPTIFKFILKWLAKVFGKASLFSLSMHSVSNGIKSFISPLSMMVAGILTIGASTELNNMLSQAKLQENKILYEKMQSGLSFEKDNLPLNSDMSMYDNNDNYVISQAKTIVDENQHKWTIRAIDTKHKDLPFTFKNVKGSFESIYNNFENAIAIQNNLGKNIGDHVHLNINNQVIDFIVKATYEKPWDPDEDKNIEKQLAPMAFISVSKLPNLSDWNIAYIVSSNTNLKSFYSSVQSYEPIKALMFGQEISKSVGILFTIVFSVYIVIIGINSIGIHISDKKQQFLLQRTITNTLGEIWRSVFYEAIIFIAMMLIITIGFMSLSFGMYALGNRLSYRISTDSSFLLMLIGGSISVCLIAFFAPLIYMNKNLRMIKK